MENTNVNQHADNLQNAERVARWEDYPSDRLLDIIENRAKRIGTMMMTEESPSEERTDAMRTVAQVKKVLLQRLQAPHAT